MAFKSITRWVPTAESVFRQVTSAKSPRTASLQQRFQSDSTAVRRQREAEAEEARALERFFVREWKAGDVYAPHDLTAAEARKWRRKKAPTTDAFDVLNISPLDLYKNFSVMSEYVTDMGRIKPRSQTGLRRVNQRRLAKAIRRAIALGLMPSVHRHPEIIRYDKKQSRRDDDLW